MSENSNEQDGPQVGIPDEALPDDLVPGEDNPLAEGLPDDETVDGLLTEGKRGDQDAAEDEESGQPDGGGQSEAPRED